MNKITFCKFAIIPNNIEKLIYSSICSENFGMNGICLDIYYKRNFFYFTLFILLLSYSFNYLYYGII